MVNELSLVSHNLTYKSDGNREPKPLRIGTGSLGVTSPNHSQTGAFRAYDPWPAHTRSTIQITTPAPERTPPTRNQYASAARVCREISERNGLLDCTSLVIMTLPHAMQRKTVSSSSLNLSKATGLGWGQMSGSTQGSGG